MLVNNKVLATFDFETDPFKHGRTPQPFCAGFYTEDNYQDFWGDDCLDQVEKYFRELETPHIIYAHNGGKFDFMFLLYEGFLSSPIKIINGRIVKAMMGIHEVRDSYALFPMPLSAYAKDEFDYSKMEREVREKHKKDILKYLYKDNFYLYQLCSEFIELYGLRLTIGGHALAQLRKYHPFPTTNQCHDERYREFYFGGRVECFETGVIEGDFKVFDTNSMYPSVMSQRKHPRSTGPYELLMGDSASAVIGSLGELRGDFDWPYFIKFRGSNRGALPTRMEDDRLSFSVEYGEFSTTSHEIQVALKYGLIDIDEILELYIPPDADTFDEFVQIFNKLKVSSKKMGDIIHTIFAKLTLNSSYGKTAQNPENFYDYVIRYGDEPYPGGYDPKLDEEGNQAAGCFWKPDIVTTWLEIWKRPSPVPQYNDVAIGASITGAARAVLMEAIANSTRPLYCDTDSIICEKLDGVKFDDYELGAWDCEGVGDKIAIAGKKLYALFSGGECTKSASKGARLEPEEILRVAQGESVEWCSISPNFKLSGETKFIKRTIVKRV